MVDVLVVVQEKEAKEAGHRYWGKRYWGEKGATLSNERVHALQRSPK
jgi:hypothetical protein